MSDPRKTFRCVKCGFEMNDMNRLIGRDTPCDNCLKIEMLKEKMKGQNVNLNKSLSNIGGLYDEKYKERTRRVFDERNKKC